jgi:hypothetical protein
MTRLAHYQRSDHLAHSGLNHSEEAFGGASAFTFVAVAIQKL